MYFFLPFFFVLNPALVLNGDALTIIVEVCTAVVGIVMIAAGLQGHLVFVGSFHSDLLSWIYRVILIIGGLALAYPEMVSNGVGIIALIVVFGMTRLIPLKT
ncbi:MAG: hypothetical protein CM1200mP4_2140 [Rhodospirillaceae bacterium]|nr:MAG: hypothetical protein CM1200mP4_2140 [Rhodospirillaceae bacterium]